LELRQVVADFFKDKYQAEYTADEVVITSGASEALDSTLRTILVEGDEVIITAPAYPAYASLIELNGGVVKYLDVSDTNFVPDINKLESLVTDKTKAILLNYPSNPTGASLTRKEVQDIANFVKIKTSSLSVTKYILRMFMKVNTSLLAHATILKIKLSLFTVCQNHTQ